MADGSDAAVIAEISLDASFVGALFEDDLANEDDVNGAAPFDDIGDWLHFDNPWRAWGAGDGFIGPFTRRPCAPGGPCQIFDARLASGDQGATGDPALANVVPGPDTAAEERLRLRLTERFVPFTREILDDGVGDDDALCEGNEDCLVLPNLGAYQGAGEPVFVDTLDNGVMLLEYPE
jgi:hypothetical protein